MYYLYKIESIYSGVFYIGATKNIQRRSQLHFSRIRDLVRYHILHPKVKKRYAEPTFRNPIYIQLAMEIAPMVKQYLTPNLSIKSHYRFIILHTSESWEEISEMETELIAPRNKLIQNIQKTSRYTDNSPLKMSAWKK